MNKETDSAHENENLDTKLDREVTLKSYEAGLENIKYHISCEDSLDKSSHNIFTLLLAGVYALLAFGMREVSSGNAMALASLVTGLFLASLAITHMLISMMPYKGHPPTNSPMNLLITDYKWHEVLQSEIPQLQDRINNIIESNEAKGKRLKLVRLWACITPFVYALAWLITSCFT